MEKKNDKEAITDSKMGSQDKYFNIQIIKALQLII